MAVEFNAEFGMASIVVKFMGPTNSRGLRYKAICQAGSITVSADYGYLSLRCKQNEVHL